MPIRALIVDIDGVVINTPHERAWREVLAELHPGAVLTREEYATLVAGKPRLDGARAALDAHGITAESADVAYAAAKQARFLALIEQGDFSVFPDAARFLAAACAARLCLAAASSSKNAAAMLAKANFGGTSLAHLFHADLSGRDVPQGKPAPDLFLLAAAELAILPAECLVLEDSPAGIEAARAAGMTALGVARNADAAHLQEAGADLVVATLDDPTAHALLARKDIPHG
jgi:beta-phosphoglucomutase